MGFKDTIVIMLNMLNRSLQIELNNIYENILKKDYAISKQAFSENRQKISPNAFVELNNAINQVIYKESDEYELWDGYRLTAVDGTILELPDTDLLRDEFGYSSNAKSKVARAKATCVFDVVNRIVINSKIDKYNTSERKMAMELLENMLKDSNFKELILFDRGYPSAELISMLFDSNAFFVMRCSSSCFKTKIKSNQVDQQIEIVHKKKKYTVRVVKFLLDSGVEETLLTNLFDTKYGVEEFKNLYFMRWGIETKYDIVKNRLEIENFSGTTRIAVEQDFYATIYLSNMVELAKKVSDQMIQTEQHLEEIVYEYQTNINTLIGTLKDKFIIMLLTESKRKRDLMYKEIMGKVANSRVPKRKKRNNLREISLSRGKYKKNRKRSL